MLNGNTLIALLPLLAFCCMTAGAQDDADTNGHGLVGLRPLSRDERDHRANHGGSWAGTPTYAEQKGNYPFVAYWGLNEKFDDLDPEKNQLVKKIKTCEKQGGTLEHILIAREYRLAIHRGHKDAKPGPFKEDTRILYEKDIDDIRAMFKKAHKQGIL